MPTDKLGSVRKTLKGRSLEELQDFILEYAKEDTGFANALVAHFDSPQHAAEIREMEKLAQKAAKEAIGYGGDYPYCNLASMEREISKCTERGDFKAAFAYALSAYDKLLEIVQYEQECEISDEIASWVDKIGDLSRQAGEKGDGESCEYIFGRCMNVIDSEMVEVGDDFRQNFFQYAANVITESRREEFEDAIDGHLGDSGYNNDIALAKLTAIGRLDGQEAAQGFAEKNLEFDSVRTVAYARAMEQGDWEAAANLCLDYPASDGSSETVWAIRLFDAYSAAGKTDLMAEAAEDVVLSGDISYYERMKSLHVELGDWEDVYPRILSGIKRRFAHFETRAYMKILSMENELELLFEQVKSNPRSLYEYGAQLESSYHDELAALFLDDINKDAETAKTRNHYADICARIKAMHDAGFPWQSASLISKYRQQFANRPAFLDELARIDK